MTVTGNGYTSAGDVATPSTEPVPYTRSVRMAYTVRPDYLLDYEATAEYQIGTRAAAEDLAQQRVGVNEHFDDLQIVEAATLKADGRRLDVPPGKIMKKSSSDHGAALFDADETIRIIIFPDVSPGDRIRYVIRYRAKKPWLPDGFEIGRTASPWFRYSDLVISLDAPAGMKLHSHAKGFAPPNSTAQGGPFTNGRSRLCLTALPSLRRWRCGIADLIFGFHPWPTCRRLGRPSAGVPSPPRRAHQPSPVSQTRSPRAFPAGVNKPGRYSMALFTFAVEYQVFPVCSV